jgi:hypothetical protein
MAVVTVDEMLGAGKLMTLDSLREELSRIEPLVEHVFPTSPEIAFEIGADWAATPVDEPANAWLTTPGGTRYQLTKQAVLEVGAYAKMPRGLSPWMAPTIYQDFLNWAYRTGLGENKEYKILAHDRPAGEDGVVPAPLALAACRGTISQFSNLALLDAVEGAVRDAYGSSEILVDSGGRKFHSDLERTNLRLIIPERVRNITRTRVGDDRWSAGVALTNSLTGVSHPGTSLHGYLFRWWCTNGCTDTLANGSRLSRRTIADPADAYAWARSTVDEILGGLESTFDHIQELADIPVGGGEGSQNVEVGRVLGDLFTAHSVPEREQARIMAQMAELGGDLSLYDVQQAITFAANDDSVSPRTADRLLELGGYVAHASHDRCDGTIPGGCHQLLPPELAALAAQAASFN